MSAERESLGDRGWSEQDKRRLQRLNKKVGVLRRVDEDERKAADLQLYSTTYDEYNKSLRGWFVAYGVGSLALFITQADELKFLEPGTRGASAAMLLAGVAVQVIGAFLNKYASLYQREKLRRPSGWKDHFLSRTLVRYSTWILADVIADALTVLLFAIATGLLVISLVK